jgi:hypothetical protein
MTIRPLIAPFVMVALDAISAQAPTLLDRVAWMQGCWEMSTSERTVEEVWLAPKGGSMMGISRTVQGNAMTGYELILLRDNGDRLAYEAHPSGQRAATFLSTSISSSEIVFENPKHDFPQQIGYRINGSDLLAWITGTQNGKTRRLEFPYKRVSCATR